MMRFDDDDLCRGQRGLALPASRPSFLDPHLECEPWIDACRCGDLLVLFLLNRPIALMPGSSLDHVSLNTLLNQLRHRAPRKHQCST